MTEKKTPLDQALDLFVYAPLGLAMVARDELPRLIDKGRQQVTGQVAMAKMMGEFAVKEGQKEGAKLVRQATERLAGSPATERQPAGSAAERQAGTAATARTASSPAGNGTGPARAKGAAGAAPTSNGAGSSNGLAGAATSASTPSAAASPPAAAPRSSAPAPAPAASGLAIPGYDTLAASQVITRLAGLSGEELEAVRTYELATRHRKTILSRISQLQTPA